MSRMLQSEQKKDTDTGCSVTRVVFDANVAGNRSASWGTRSLVATSSVSARAASGTPCLSSKSVLYLSKHTAPHHPIPLLHFQVSQCFTSVSIQPPPHPSSPLSSKSVLYLSKHTAPPPPPSLFSTSVKPGFSSESMLYFNKHTPLFCHPPSALPQ